MEQNNRSLGDRFRGNGGGGGNRGGQRDEGRNRDDQDSDPQRSPQDGSPRQETLRQEGGRQEQNSRGNGGYRGRGGYNYPNRPAGYRRADGDEDEKERQYRNQNRTCYPDQSSDNRGGYVPRHQGNQYPQNQHTDKRREEEKKKKTIANIRRQLATMDKQDEAREKILKEKMEMEEAGRAVTLYLEEELWR
uniref:Cwf21 domain-containing protein n=1 Tax=Caenorhabditis tropicalis TaxID=1561998 RepID=A0A1I7TR43_9PELO